MNRNSNEKRIIRRLRNAYAYLLSQHPEEPISVTELTDCAEMARATFYLHYENMDAFRKDCFVYILQLALQQCRSWFENGRGGIAEGCKKNKLLLTTLDRDLLTALIRQQAFVEYYDLLQTFDLTEEMKVFYADKASCFTAADYGKCKLFFVGFVTSCLGDLVEYSSSKMRSHLTYMFDIFEYLFPQLN